MPELRPAARICCLDLDTFFVSVERLLDPSLEGLPVVVGARPGQRGVVTAASYEVRAFGVRSGMSMTEAVKLAPHAVFLPTRHGVYSPYAARVKAVLERFCPEVQTASIDEFFLDFRGCERVYSRPSDAGGDAAILRAVRQMRQAVQDEVGLPASAGLGGTRVVAKMASRDAKPAGVFLVPIGRELDFVWNLSVRALPGIGPSGEQRLVGAGIRTLGELLDLPPGPLRARFGSQSAGVRHRLLAPHRLGRDRPAFSEHDPVGGTVGTISNESTFWADVSQVDRVEKRLRALSERVCWRARRRGVRARTITLKLRRDDFHTISRARTLPPTDEERVVGDAIVDLFRANWDRRAVRLVGVQLSNLVGEDTQLALPLPAGGAPPVGPAIDAIRERFGYDAIRLGAVVTLSPPVAAEPDGPRAGTGGPAGGRHQRRPHPG
ncbi:MAG: DNA polymerase-4 [Myxococcota bacterium]|jgi:DNA polymerase-4